MKKNNGSKVLIETYDNVVYWICNSCLLTGVARVNNWNSPRARTCCGGEFYKGRDRLLIVWTDMNERCTNPEHPAYSRYFHFGPPQWSGLAEFKRWALSSGWKRTLEIDRIDNSIGYSPQNCRFVSRSQNLRNKKNNRIVTAFDESKTLSDWVDDPRCSVSFNTLFARLNRGWEAERAITQKVH